MQPDPDMDGVLQRKNELDEGGRKVSKFYIPTIIYHVLWVVVVVIEKVASNTF